MLFLPAVLDTPSPERAHRYAILAELADAGDTKAIAALLLAELPPGVRRSRDAAVWADEQAARLCTPALRRALRELPLVTPVADRSVLAGVRTRCLVVGQAHDAVHDQAVASEVAAALPGAQVEVFAEGAAVWTARRRLRALLGGFLG
ncbi:MAG: hypothetical protein M3Q27_01135 [Actinomycetota bacterium]|nr:hypothetical protein [Actinomycetota bacterium]